MYYPWYLDGSCRPVIQSLTPAALTYGTTGNTVYFTWDQGECPSVEVTKAVLIAPGAVTHHFDQHQRYVELGVTQVEQPNPSGQGYVKFKTPSNRTYAPPGWYMMFLVTAGGIPSVAKWVLLR